MRRPRDVAWAKVGLCAIFVTTIIPLAAAQSDCEVATATTCGATTTLAGSGSRAFADGIGAAASFHLPRGVAESPDGLTVYVADHGNHRIRAIDVTTGETTTLAGSGSQGSADGIGAAASFHAPCGVAVSPDGRIVYVADRYNHRIRAIDTATGEATTLAGSGSGAFANGIGAAASFHYPSAVAVSPNDRTLYVADNGNHRIREVHTLPAPSPRYTTTTRLCRARPQTRHLVP